MEPPPYTIRVLTKNDLPQASELWKTTGYRLGIHFLEAYLEVDSESLWGACTDSGELIGFCSAVLNQEDLVYFSCYIVKESLRGLGIGTRVWNACLEHVGDRNAAVSAVPGKKEIYRDRGGFPVEETRWHYLCYIADIINHSALLNKVDGVQFKPVDKDSLSIVLEYDFSVVKYRRTKLISTIFKQKSSILYLALKGQKCVGYGFATLSIDGRCLISPLYADDQDIAESLLWYLIESFPVAKGICLRVSSEWKDAEIILGKLNSKKSTYVVSALFKKQTIPVDVNKIFVFSSFSIH